MFSKKKVDIFSSAQRNRYIKMGHKHSCNIIFIGMPAKVTLILEYKNYWNANKSYILFNFTFYW